MWDHSYIHHCSLCICRFGARCGIIVVFITVFYVLTGLEHGVGVYVSHVVSDSQAHSKGLTVSLSVCLSVCLSVIRD